MRPAIIIDIETRPDPAIWENEEHVEQIKAGLSAPANYKDELKIQAHIDGQFQTLVDKAALRPTTGKVVCVGMTYPDGSPDVRVNDDEGALLRMASSHMGFENPLVIAGMNVREFDLPFLTMRCAVHGIDLPDWWPHRRDWRGVADLLDLFPSGMMSLDDMLRAFGLPAKLCSGKDSLELPLDELQAYNEQELTGLHTLFERLAPRFPALREKP